MPSTMKLGALTFKSPSVYVLFKGKQPGQQVVRPHNALPLREDSTLRTIIQEAALMRFRKELDLSDSVITVAAAATLMPEMPQDLAEVVRIEEQSAETTDKELWVHVALEIGLLSGTRAWAADVMYRALKTEATMNNITFSDTLFAKVALNKKCCALTKALGHSLTEPTPSDGKLVMMIEQKVEAYRNDFDLLRTDLAAYRAAQQAAMAQVQAAADEASHNHFGPLGVVFLTTYLQAYISAKDDRAQRVRILQSILRNAQAENDLDSSWWTPKKVETKLKKMARAAR